MNCPMASLTGPDGCQSYVLKKRFCRAGNNSVALSPESSRRAGATSRTESSHSRVILFTEVNGRKHSCHWTTSISPCQSSRDTAITRLFNVGREYENEFKTCARAESCQSNGLQDIFNCSACLRLSPPSRPQSVTLTAQLKNSTRAVWIVVNLSVRWMKCPSSGASNTS